MHTLFGNSIRKRLLPIITAAMLAACTAENTYDGPVPSEGSLVIEPASITFSVGPAVGCLGVTTKIERYVISTFDEEGRLRGNADIEITVTFSGSTTISGLVVTELIDPGVGIVSTSASPVPYKTTTEGDGENVGTKEMFVAYEVSGGCQYAGNIMVTSGSVVTFSSFDFTD
jgi:hypothetical protein